MIKRMFCLGVLMFTPSCGGAAEHQPLIPENQGEKEVSISKAQEGYFVPSRFEAQVGKIVFHEKQCTLYTIYYRETFFIFKDTDIQEDCGLELISSNQKSNEVIAID